MNYELPNFSSLLSHRPDAWAMISGQKKYYEIHGRVRFYQTKYGVVVVSEVGGLPTQEGACEKPIYAFHIHEGSSCSGSAEDPFARTGMHYNPYECPHPYHAGDLPPLFASNGYAFSAVLTDRFTVKDIVGKTILIHSGVDDFTSQPAGNSGIKIACGEIKG